MVIDLAFGCEISRHLAVNALEFDSAIRKPISYCFIFQDIPDAHRDLLRVNDTPINKHKTGRMPDDDS